MTKRPRRIALLHYSCPPIIGGVEFILAAHARLLVDAGHHVEIIVGEGHEFDKRIPVRRIHGLAGIPPEKIADLLKSDDLSSMTSELADALAHALAGFDVCACHNVLTMHFNPVAANALAAVVSNPRSPRLIAWSHDASLLCSDYAHLRFDHPCWDYLRRPVPHVTYVTISDARRRQLSRLFHIPRERIAVIPDGVDLKALLRLTDTAERILHEERLDLYDVVALTPARIVRRKNLELGVDFIEALIKAGKSVRWLITGAPDRQNPATIAYFDEIQHLLKTRGLAPHVRFLGASGERIRFATLCSLYLLCDLMLLPSREEGFGIPLLEAGLSARLLVVGDIPVLKELAGDHAVYLGKQPVAHAARKVIHYLDSDPRSLMRKNVLRHYTWRNLFKRQIEPLFLRETSGRKPS